MTTEKEYGNVTTVAVTMETEVIVKIIFTFQCSKDAF